MAEKVQESVEGVDFAMDISDDVKRSLRQSDDGLWHIVILIEWVLTSLA